MDSICIPSAHVRGIVSCVPARLIDNQDLADSLDISRSRRLIDAIGVRRRRVSTSEQKVSDFALHAAEHLLSKLNWQKTSIDGIILITQFPDRCIPATACHLHRRLQLGKRCFAFDVNLGCSAYPYGLWIAQQLMDGLAIKRVLLICGDLPTRNQDVLNPETSLLFGDAATATALEMDQPKTTLVEKDIVLFGTDGTGEGLIELGPYKQCRSSGADESLYAAPTLRMDGRAVVSFAINVVPNLIRTLNESRAGLGNHAAGGHDYYLLHQANASLLDHIGKKADIIPAKLPTNIADYGNTASASIPLLITTNLSSLIRESQLNLAMIGFGTGLSWSAISKKIGPLAVVDTLKY